MKSIKGVVWVLKVIGTLIISPYGGSNFFLMVLIYFPLLARAVGVEVSGH